MLRVRDAMTTAVIRASPTDTLQQAHDLFEEGKIRHLPIVEGRKLIGVVSDRDLRDTLPPRDYSKRESVLRDVEVREIVSGEPITAHPLDTIDHAASQLYERKIGCLPVVDGGELVGIITSSDVMRLLTELTGAYGPGSWVEVEVPNRPGMLASVTGVIKDLNVNIAAVFLSPDKGVSYRLIVLRLDTTDPSGVAASLEEAGYEVYSVESTAPVETTLEEA